jgi:hypothetical protein
MPGLVPGIHVFARHGKEDVDGRAKPGHDENKDGRKTKCRSPEKACC